jgi:hypothetical protein
MSGENRATTGEQAETTNVLDAELSRRRAMQAGLAAGAAAVGIGAGAGSAAAASTVNYGDSEVAHDPRFLGTVTVEDHESDMSELQYVADDGSVVDLQEHGIVLRQRPDTDTTTAHNPVSLMASAFETDEFWAFPRGVTYDDDGDDSTDEVDVSALDSTHYSTSGSALTVENPDDHELRFVTSSISSENTATLDLSTVGSTDGTIDDGIDRKFFQVVADVDQLNAGALVEARITSTGGSTKTVTVVDSDGDTSTEGVLFSATGDSKVGEARLGELSTDISDIETVTFAFSGGDVDLTLHALNLEKETRWQFGEQEIVNSDDEIETETVEGPSGQFSITSLQTLDGTPFEDAAITSVDYEAEMRASEMPAANHYVEVSDAERYDEPKKAKVARVFEWPTAYTLSTSVDKLVDEVELPQTRYVQVAVAVGASEIDELSDTDDLSTTSRTSNYDAIGNDVDMATAVTSGDRVISVHEVLLTESEASSFTASSSGAAVAVGSGGGNNGLLAVVGGGLIAAAVWFRSNIMALFGR